MRRLPRARLGADFSEGARLLWLAVESRQLDQKTLDSMLGVSSGLGNRLLYGERKPGRALADTLREIFGIAPALWDASPTEPFVPPGARDVTPDEPIPYTVTRTGSEG